MLILSEFDIQFNLPAPAAMVALLHLHPSLEPRIRSGNELYVEHLGSASTPTGAPSTLTGFPLANVADPSVVPRSVPITYYTDSFGNRCSRFVAPAGHVRLSGRSVIDADPYPDPIYAQAGQALVENLPSEVLQFLLPSRYCEVDQFVPIAQDLFGWMTPGWTRAIAIRDWVHAKVLFDYKAARPTKTSMDVFTERIGVCRDFQHLAITLSRCQNIPARYVTGYIGDIRMPFGGPGDFSAWYQVFLDGRWIDLDARHNYPRLGRILMATGRDAADVAITTSFGSAPLVHFSVESNEIDAAGNKVPLPAAVVLPGAAMSSPVSATQTASNQPAETQSGPNQTQPATN